MSKPQGGASTPLYTLLSVTPVHHDFAPVLQVGMNTCGTLESGVVEFAQTLC